MSLGLNPSSRCKGNRATVADDFARDTKFAYDSRMKFNSLVCQMGGRAAIREALRQSPSLILQFRFNTSRNMAPAQILPPL